MSYFDCDRCGAKLGFGTCPECRRSWSAELDAEPSRQEPRPNPWLTAVVVAALLFVIGVPVVATLLGVPPPAQRVQVVPCECHCPEVQP